MFKLWNLSLISIYIKRCVGPCVCVCVTSMIGLKLFLRYIMFLANIFGDLKSQKQIFWKYFHFFFKNSSNLSRIFSIFSKIFLIFSKIFSIFSKIFQIFSKIFQIFQKYFQFFQKYLQIFFKNISIFWKNISNFSKIFQIFQKYFKFFKNISRLFFKHDLLICDSWLE